MRTLFLTSPHLRGSDVEQLQRALDKRNVFEGSYLQSPVDGEFGPASARACIRAKFWLGYSERDLAVQHRRGGTAGDTLRALLSGKRELPKGHKARRTRRLKAAKNKPLREKALAFQRARLGEKEHPPGSNRSSSSLWYRMIGPWCLMDVTQAYVHSGSKAFERGKRWAYCPFLLHDARMGSGWVALTTIPQPGDVFLVDWERNGIVDHAGLFDHWTNKPNGGFKTIEGNTGIGNNSNGGERMQRDRKLSDGRFFFIHVGR